MKALEILKWVCYIGKDSEFFNILEIDEDFDFESYFGYPHEAVEEGYYFFYYSDCIDCNGITVPTDSYCRDVKTILPTFSIETDFNDKDGNKVFIHFYKVEE